MADGADDGTPQPQHLRIDARRRAWRRDEHRAGLGRRRRRAEERGEHLLTQRLLDARRRLRLNHAHEDRTRLVAVAQRRVDGGGEPRANGRAHLRRVLPLQLPQPSAATQRISAPPTRSAP